MEASRDGEGGLHLSHGDPSEIAPSPSAHLSALREDDTAVSTRHLFGEANLVQTPYLFNQRASKNRIRGISCVDFEQT